MAFGVHSVVKCLSLALFTKGTSFCIISEMFGKLKLGKSVIFFICQIAAFTLFPNLNFPNISEMKQTDMS